MASMLTGLPQCEIMPIPSYSLDSALYQCSIEGLFIELPIIVGLGIITIGGAPAYVLKAGVAIVAAREAYDIYFAWNSGDCFSPSAVTDLARVTIPIIIVALAIHTPIIIKAGAAIVAAIEAYDIYCKVKLAWNSGDYFSPSFVTDLAISTISIITIVALTIHTPIIIKAGVFTAAAIVTCNSFYVAKLAWDSGDYFSSSFTAVVGFAIPIIAYAAPTAPVAAAGVMTYTIALKLAGTYALMHTISCTSGKIGQEYQGTDGLILGRMAGNLLKSQVTSRGGPIYLDSFLSYLRIKTTYLCSY